MPPGLFFEMPSRLTTILSPKSARPSRPSVSRFLVNGRTCGGTATVFRRSKAGRFAYNLRVSPIRPHADTSTPPNCGCGSAALWNLWFQIRNLGLMVCLTALGQEPDHLVWRHGFLLVGRRANKKRGRSVCE